MPRGEFPRQPAGRDRNFHEMTAAEIFETVSEYLSPDLRKWLDVLLSSERFDPILTKKINYSLNVESGDLSIPIKDLEAYLKEVVAERVDIFLTSLEVGDGITAEESAFFRLHLKVYEKDLAKIVLLEEQGGHSEAITRFIDLRRDLVFGEEAKKNNFVKARVYFFSIDAIFVLGINEGRSSEEMSKSYEFQDLKEEFEKLQGFEKEKVRANMVGEFESFGFTNAIAVRKVSKLFGLLLSK